MIMTPMVHLLLLPLLLSITAGKDLEEKKGLLEDKVLDVTEGTPVPYPMYQFQVKHQGVNRFRLTGEGRENIKISNDGWLYLERPLDWSRENNYMLTVEALEDDEVVEGPIHVTINVLDINNNAPYFNHSVYAATIRENSRAGVPFIRVFATDRDDPETPNAHLSYSLVSQIPNNYHKPLFQINSETGEISTTEEGKQMLKAGEGIQYSNEEDWSTDMLKRKFDGYCPGRNIPYDKNPFYTCVEKSEMRRRNVNPLDDPDYTLIVRVQDLGGESENALSGNTRVQIVVEQNLWVNPGPLTITEHLDTTYPLLIAKVQSNDPDALYSLVQKERELKFPFMITADGSIYLMEELDREAKDMYILVVLASDTDGNELDPPMEIHVFVEDVNDNPPVCEKEESVLEVQEGEDLGSMVGELKAYDADEENTLNSQLTYTILSQDPETTPPIFAIDGASGRIQSLGVLQRRDQQVYNLMVKVSDPDFSTECKVIIKVIDVNNELPLFEENDYGSHTLAEDTPVGHTILTIRATDDDDPDSGSSRIEFHISAGQDDDFFAVETNGTGVGHLVVAKPLDFESSPIYKLQIDARNPEPLMKGLEYGSESTAFVTLSVTDVDEAPEFSLEIPEVTVAENITKGSVLLTVEAKDPEGKEIGFKLDGDTQGWLEIDAATGELKTKKELDREAMETFEVTVIAFEKENPEKSSEQVVSVRLLDVNDNVPKLVEKQGFICVKTPKPVIIKAKDIDNSPFSEPFTFLLGSGKKSPNWELVPIDDTSARLTLKKLPNEEKTFLIPITIKDNAGMGVPQSFEVKVCNCTELGYCYMEPRSPPGSLGMGPTVGILAGTVGFCIIAFVVVVRRVNKKKQKTKARTDEEEKNVMM